jgi:hypothetical protein
MTTIYIHDLYSTLHHWHLQIRPIPLQTLIIPAQKLPTQRLLAFHSQIRNHTTRLLWAHQLALLVQPLELGLITLAHSLVMLLANRTLHLRVHNARPDTHSRNIRFLNRQRGREVVQDRFARPVCAPALVRACRCAATRDHNSALGRAQCGERGLHHTDSAEHIDIVCLTPFLGCAVGDLLHGVEGAVVDDKGVEPAEA